jgi:hypothetical protein
LALFEVDAISENDRAVERETGLRAVPRDELTNHMVVRALTAGGGLAVQHGRLGLLEIEGQNPLGLTNDIWEFL